MSYPPRPPPSREIDPEQVARCTGRGKRETRARTERRGSGDRQTVAIVRAGHADSNRTGRIQVDTTKEGPSIKSRCRIECPRARNHHVPGQLNNGCGDGGSGWANRPSDCEDRSKGECVASEFHVYLVLSGAESGRAGRRRSGSGRAVHSRSQRERPPPRRPSSGRASGQYERVNSTRKIFQIDTSPGH